jgi:hypothetical protein
MHRKPIESDIMQACNSGTLDPRGVESLAARTGPVQ